MGSKPEREYASQADYAGWVRKTTQDHIAKVTTSLQEAFKDFIHKEEIDIIVFSKITVKQLANGIISFPLILKPLLIATNIAARAIERDLGIKNLDTYDAKNLEKENALSIAGYIKPFLPDSLPLPALTEMDRIMFEDKEIRKIKGQWEKMVVKSLNSYADSIFRKSKFLHSGQGFELDAAVKNKSIIICAADIKRIEARRDIHKRTDEIANKAAHLKAVFPKAKFGAIIYYPFITEHGNVRDRLQSSDIDSVVFAGASMESINNAIKLLLSKLGCLKKH